MEEEFIELFEHIQGILLSYPAYEVSKPEASRKKVKTFLQSHPTIAGDMWSFLCFIFMCKTSKMNRHIIVPLNQFLSKNAAKRFSDRKAADSYHCRKFIKQNNIRKPSHLEKGLSEEYLASKREKYFNTPRGFIECQSFDGALFSPNICNRCQYYYICSVEKITY